MNNWLAIHLTGVFLHCEEAGEPTQTTEEHANSTTSSLSSTVAEEVP